MTHDLARSYFLLKKLAKILVEQHMLYVSFKAGTFAIYTLKLLLALFWLLAVTLGAFQVSGWDNGDIRPCRAQCKRCALGSIGRSGRALHHLPGL